MLEFDLIHHDVEDLGIGMIHAHPSDVSHALDGRLHIVLDDPLARMKGQAAHAQVMGQDRRIHGGGDLGRAGYRPRWRWY